MFSLIARWQISRPVSDFLLSEDYESIWGLSFHWCNLEAPPDTPLSIPEDVAKTIHRIVLGVFKEQLSARRPDGSRIPVEPFDFIADVNPWRNFFWRCLQKSKFDKAYLSKLFVARSEVLAWCEEVQISPPHFWVKATSKDLPPQKLSLENRLRNNEVDRLACQAIARIYWEIDPNIHPSHLASSRAIKLYGNGKLYADEDTLKGWISEVDPVQARKSGRPKKITYRIDLETGGLNP